jgi:dipeptidase E
MEDYTALISEAFKAMELPYKVAGIESFANPRTALETAEAVFVGGGNTFLLLRTMYKHDVMPILESRAEDGLPFMGSSAGSNVAGITIHTSNDMTIVTPPTLTALGLVPFNINPHYPREESQTHNGETRDQRVFEFHSLPENDQAVLALREDSMIRIVGDNMKLISADGSPARLFRQGQEPVELSPGELGL